VSVVAGHRAEKSDRFAFCTPGRTGPGRSPQPGVEQVEVHQRQAAVPTGDHLVRMDAEQIGSKSTGLRQSVEAAVVAGVNARVGDEAPVPLIERVG
ncbi:uncharacterized protein METZ01_LOCUS56760, partial [marine metagenome]